MSPTVNRPLHTVTQTSRPAHMLKKCPARLAACSLRLQFTKRASVKAQMKII